MLRRRPAAGADELFFLEGYASEGLDSYSTALTLAAAIDKTGKHDLILSGRMAALYQRWHRHSDSVVEKGGMLRVAPATAASHDYTLPYVQEEKK